MLEECESDHRHERMAVKALPGSSLEMSETELFFELLMRLLANPLEASGSSTSTSSNHTPFKPPTDASFQRSLQLTQRAQLGAIRIDNTLDGGIGWIYTQSIIWLAASEIIGSYARLGDSRHVDQALAEEAQSGATFLVLD